MATGDPRAARPHIPGYGIPKTRRGMLPWEQVAAALARSPRYWIATTDSDGAPHVIQQWGAFIDGSLYFEGGSHTRWARNLARDPRVAASAEAEGLAIMVEGRVDRLTPDATLANAIIGAYREKPYGYVPEVKNWEGDGLVAVRPAKVFAWKVDSFNTTATRFTFGPPVTASPPRARGRSARAASARPR
ncbi:MAG TPA: pyridoxamine 5'-phosphate oxidase family protein [Candidatus Limnocylindria bacterium]|nr:pyridoxamine 5'-phosphate oxidase family protein [Candidatus Limnocylindria bacterium]